MTERAFTAFISYRHQSPDKDVAQRLHTAIETYRIPAAIRKKTGRKKMGLVFRDEEELPLSSDLGKDIETALDSSDWLIAVCSPRYLESRWCMRELEYFIEKKGRDHVLTILVEGEPKDSFPAALQVREDGKGVEPLAADVRAESAAAALKKLKGEKLRLLAPMLGVPYDDLRMRERQRRRKRIASLAAAALVSAGALTGVLIHNERLREEAREQERIAEEQRRLAEEERVRAEQERLSAVSNSIGEALQVAAAYREDSDNRRAAGTLLDALALSEANGDMRRAEILDGLRRAMYIEPFTVVSKLDLQNTRLTNAQMSADGKRAVCIANGNSLAMLDLEQSRVAYAVSKGNEQVDYVGFSPDGSRFVALYGYYHYATVWNTEDGSEVFTYTSKTDEKQRVSGAVFLGNADTLLVQDHDRIYRISLPDGKEELFYTVGEQQDGYDYTNNLYTFIFHKPLDEIITLGEEAYPHVPLLASPDGTKVLVSGLVGKTGTIILNEKGERVSLLDRMSAVIMDRYALSPDGKYAFCISPAMNLVCGWETESGRLRYMNKYNGGFFNGISDPVFSPDSSKVAYILQDRLVVSDAARGKELAGADLEWEDPVQPFLYWSADGGLLTCFTPNLYFIGAESGNVILHQPSGINDMYNNAVPAGDSLVLVTRGGGEAVLYSLPAAASVAFREDYSGGMGGYDPLSAPASPWAEEPVSEHHLTETFMSINGIAQEQPQLFYSREGNYAAWVSQDGNIEVFRKEEPGKVYLQTAQFIYAPAAFGIVGDTMVAADNTSRLMFQNLKDGTMTVLKEGAAHTTFVFSGNFLMASRGDALAIDVYDVEKAELLFSMVSAEPFEKMGFSDDGNWAAGLTAGGQYMTGDLLQDETALLEAAGRFAPAHWKTGISQQLQPLR